MMWMLLTQRNFSVDLLEKVQPQAVGVLLGGVSDNFALQVIQRGKEGDRCDSNRGFECGYVLCPKTGKRSCNLTSLTRQPTS
jgi:hypothetical protein